MRIPTLLTLTLLILAFCVFHAEPCFGAAYTSTQSGNWSSAATWGGAGVPGNGDTATIAAGHTITVDINTTVGTSPAAGTNVLTITTTGKLIVAAGVTFVVRGDTVYTSTATGDPVVLLNAGATWEFDSSAAADPANTSYKFEKSSTGNHPRAFQCAGMAGARCTVRSNAGGGNGRFTFTSGGSGPSLIADYTDFVRLGTSSLDAFYLTLGGGGSSLNVQNSTFTDCGEVSIRLDGGTHTFKNNVHTGAKDSEGVDLRFAYLAGTPTVLLEGNIFTGWVGSVALVFSPVGHTIKGNYFAHPPRFSVTGSYAWTEYSGNLAIVGPGDSVSAPINSDASDSYFLLNRDGYDYHFTASTILRPWVVSNSVFEWSGTHTSFGGYDAILIGQPASLTTFGSSGNIFTRAMGVYSGATSASGYPHTFYSMVTNGRLQANHNSAYIPGYYGIFLTGTNATPGLVTSYKSNLIRGSSPAPAHIQEATSMNDACATNADCDYNSASAGLTPAQYYLGSWTTPPGPPTGVGANDTEAEPRLADETRQLPNFDVRYLGVSLGTTWQTATSYAVGDIVSAADSAVYSGEALNYRCIAAHTSSSTNRPGTGSAWRTNWEWASLYQIRQRVAAQSRYTDGAIGCSNCTVIQALIRWVRRGWTPQNLVLYGKAHDGGTPGAVPMDPPVTRGAWW